MCSALGDVCFTPNSRHVQRNSACPLCASDHQSFGCRDKARWTYFGDAFFNVALRQAKNLKDAFVVARALVQKRELHEHIEPSDPLMAGGANVQPLLIARP